MQPVERECLSELIIHESRSFNSVCNDNRRASLYFSFLLCGFISAVISAHLPGPFALSVKLTVLLMASMCMPDFCRHLLWFCACTHTHVWLIVCVGRQKAYNKTSTLCYSRNRFVTWSLLLMEALSLAIMNQTVSNLVLLSIH